METLEGRFWQIYEEKKLGFRRIDGGKGFTDNEQAGPKKQKVIRKEGMSREERLNLYIATCMDPSSIRPSLFGPDKDVDLSVPHMLTFREFASMCLDDIEHGVSTYLMLSLFILNFAF